MAIGAASGIGWLNGGATLNALAGCKKRGPECNNCYAIPTSLRLAGNPNEKIQTKYAPVVNKETGDWTGVVTFTPAELEKCLRSKKQENVFVNSMSDLFYDEVQTEWIDQHFAVMALTQWKFFQVLTKREKRMFEYMSDKHLDDRIGATIEKLRKELGMTWNGVRPQWALGKIFPLPNLIMGVSAGQQETVDQRVPYLLDTPNLKYRVLSLEPLLDFVDLTSVCDKRWPGDTKIWFDALYKKALLARGKPAPGLDWVQVGGESQKRVEEVIRPASPWAIRRVIDDCQAAGVPVFFKQWGEWVPVDQVADPEKLNFKGESMYMRHDGQLSYTGEYLDTCCSACSTVEILKMGKHKAGNLIDGRVVEEYPPIQFGEYINYWGKS